MSQPLPVEECLPDVIKALRAARPVILRAPPGAGKTTGVPPAILASNDASGGTILLVQPRRMAARAAAGRMGRMAGEPVGQTYGYHVRFDRKVSPQTRVVAVTTGILLRRLMSDPLLEGVAAVILDEFHERSLELDLALGMLHRVRSTFREDLRLIVMSATLETEPVAALLTDAVTIESGGRAFDVELRYDNHLSPGRLTRQEISRRVIECLPEALSTTPGDVLVFLPGVGEIHHAAKQIADLADRHGVRVCKLYGDLAPEKQDLVLAPSSDRKIVLATNVAETSVTLPGITCVIDTGLARFLRYDSAVGIPSLQLGPISKASADQRAGRAGRTAPGICFRLWPLALHRSRPDQTSPEIAEADLSAALLTLASWGERDVFQFPWVTPPRRHAVESAHRLLIQLGAVDGELALTTVGKQMSSLPLHPRLSRLLLASVEHHCTDHAVLVAALLSERSPIDPAEASASQRRGIQSDLIDQAVRMQQYFDGHAGSGIHRGGAKTIARVCRTLQKTVDRLKVAQPSADDAAGDEKPRPPAPLDESLTRALLEAFPDRIAKRREAGSESALMVGGRGVRLDRASTVRHPEYFLCIDIDGRGEESWVRMASGVHPSWLPTQHLRRKQEVFFDAARQSVVARDRTFFLDLLIQEAPAACHADASTAEILFQHAAECLDQILDPRDKKLQSLVSRWRFLDSHSVSDRMPLSIDQALQQVLRELCHARLSFKELSNAPWSDHLQALLSYEQLKWFQQQAPESLVVPSGNRIRLEYQSGRPPVLAVRIQEVFGWKQTPRLAAGSVPVQLHLLGPNHRPQQITDDLESFWQTTYPEIRKELKRRYAKHHWPDDPWSATATRNGLKPRK